jgi:hypothetical protein
MNELLHSGEPGREVARRIRPLRSALVAVPLATVLAFGFDGSAQDEPLTTSAEGASPSAVEGESTGPLTAGQWISAVNEALLPGNSMVAQVRIVTHDGFGEDLEMTLEVVRVYEHDQVRTLVEVEAPEAGKDTTYEIVAPANGALRRRVWLPEIRRLRQITGLQRTDHFLGTEFTYEDLGFDLPLERGAGETYWVGPDRLIVLESAPYHYYGRVVTRIDPATRLPTRISFYDAAGQWFREQTFEDVREVDGHPFPMTITVHDRMTDARSVLTFQSIQFGVDVPAERFERSEIRRRLPRRDPASDPEEVAPEP